MSRSDQHPPTASASMLFPDMASLELPSTIYTPTSTKMEKVSTGRPQWDMSTFRARFESYSKIVSPFNLFKNREAILTAQALLDGTPRMKQLFVAPGETKTMSMSPPSGEERQAALQLVDSAVHPETKQIIPMLFRRSAFTMFNTPLFFAIAVTPQTTPWIVGWQAVNQTYNAFANYNNRSSDEEGSIATLVQNFALAVTGATAAAVGTKRALTHMSERFGSTASKGLVATVTTRFAPAFVASVSSSLLNLLIVRREELEDGVVVRSGPYGDAEPLGASQVAAKHALSATLQSRTLLPIASLVFPPLAAAWLSQQKGFLSRTFVRLPIVLGVVFTTQLVSLPLSLAPWAWFMPLSVDDLEPELREAAVARGLKQVYFNKGL